MQCQRRYFFLLLKIRCSPILLIFAFWLSTIAIVQAAVKADSIVIGSDVAEIIAALGATDQLLARDATCLYPETVKRLPSIGYMRQLSVESVLSMAPKRIFVSADARPQEVLQQLKASGLSVVIVPSGYDLATLKQKILVLGQALNRQLLAQQLIQHLQQQQQQIARLAPLTIRPLLLLAHGGGAPAIAGQQSAAEVLKLAGVTWLPPFRGYKRVGSEALVSLAPEVILFSPQGLVEIGGADKLWQLPGLAYTPAGQHHALIEINELALLGFGLRTPAEILRLHQALATLQKNNFNHAIRK